MPNRANAARFLGTTRSTITSCAKIYRDLGVAEPERF
jgi:hypothetical protein